MKLIGKALTKRKEFSDEHELGKKYCDLDRLVTDYENKLSKLVSTKEDIDSERYDLLEKEYSSILEKSKPLLSDIVEEISKRLTTFESEKQLFSKELSEVQRLIRQENKLFEVDAVSEKDYKIVVEPLKKKEKELQNKCNNKIKQIKILEEAKMKKFPGGDGGSKNPETKSPRPSLKKPYIAAILSVLHPGVGQIYNEELQKGIIFIVVFWISNALMLLAIGFVTSPIILVWAIIDAYKTANTINREFAGEHG